MMFGTCIGTLQFVPRPTYFFVNSKTQVYTLNIFLLKKIELKKMKLLWALAATPAGSSASVPPG